MLFDPRPYWGAFTEVVALLRRHQELAWELTKREVRDRYAGQVFGALWAIGQPLIQIGVYLLMFVIVFHVPAAGAFQNDYAVYLLCGLIPWLGVLEAMQRGTTALAANASLVKQVVFPIELLPVKGVLAALLSQGVSWAMLVVYMLIRTGTLPATMALLPVLLVLQLLMMLGLSFALAAVGAFFRDLREFVQVFGVVGVFLMPTFYQPDMVPAVLRPLLYFNPMSYMVWCFQDACYFGAITRPWAWGAFAVLSLFCFSLGYRVFRRLKHHMGDLM